jgi:hypothetical protein
VSIVILLVLVAVLWIVVLAPSALRRFGDRQRVGSIDHFHHELELLQHAGPKRATPAYRLHTALPGGGLRSTHSVVPTSSRPKLVLLRPVDDEQSADIDGADGAHYERVGVIETPEPPVSLGQTQVELAAYRRQQARQRCTVVLRLLAAVAISTTLLGLLPSLRLAWVFTGVTGVAALALVGLIAYAREVEGQRRPRPLTRLAYGDDDNSLSGAAQAGYPGAWDEGDEGDESPEQRWVASGR